MYTRTGKVFLLVAMLGFLIADVQAFFAKCDATTPPSMIGLVIGVIWQLCAIGALALCMQYIGMTYRPPRQASAKTRLNTVVMASIFCFLSASLFRQSLLFSDTLSVRGMVSVGAACFK